MIHLIYGDSVYLQGEIKFGAKGLVIKGGFVLNEAMNAKINGIVAIRLVPYMVEGLYLQQLEGRLDPRVWHGIGKGTTGMLAAAGLHRFWSHRKDWYSPQFHEFVEAAIKSSEVASDSLYRHDA